MSSPQVHLLLALKQHLPELEFEGWYEPNFFDRGGFVIRAFEPKFGQVNTYKVVIRTDSLEPVDSLASSLANYIATGIKRQPVPQYRAVGLTTEDMKQLLRTSLPQSVLEEEIARNEWVISENYNWNKGQSGESDLRLGPLASTAIKIRVLSEDEFSVVAGWYYESGVLELLYYPKYGVEGWLSNSLTLEVGNPSRNLEIINSN